MKQTTAKTTGQAKEAGLTRNKPAEPSPQEPLHLLLQRATSAPNRIDPAQAARLQRAIGNRALGRLAGGSKQHPPSGAGSNTETADGGIVPADLESHIQRAKGSGQSFSAGVRSPMERTFGADFSGVKIHTDVRSDYLNRSLQARAFTTGQDIFFRQGEYGPGNFHKQALLSHGQPRVVPQDGAAMQRNVAAGRVQRAKPSAGLFSRERSLMKKLEKAVREEDTAEADTHAGALFAHNETYYLNLLEYKLNKHKDSNATKYKLYKERNPGLVVFQAAWQRRNQYPAIVEALSNLIVFLSPEQKVALAQEDPGFFLDHILKVWKQDILLSSQLLQLLEQAELRNILRRDVPGPWRSFAAEIPQFAVPEAVYEEVTTARHVLDDEAIIDRIFDAVVANRHIDIGYFTNNLAPLDTVPSILRGATAEEKAARLERARQDVTKPATPSAQCDNLMKILQKVVEMYPGLNTTFAIGMERQALLTVPLNTLRGGLIPNTFQGNVVDAHGAYTNQIFFTGVTDSDEPRSHTWNIIGGKAYDSVLGTKGDGVAASKAFAFRQRKAADGSWEQVWIDGAKTLTRVDDRTAADNTLGFKTAYKRNW